jgi:hypothetical protein
MDAAAATVDAKRYDAFLCPALLAILLLALAHTAYPQDAGAPPEQVEALEAEVIGVTGTVRKLPPAEGAAWQAVRVGDKLGGNTVIRTGLGSECVLKFFDRGEVTVKSCTKGGISRFLKKGDEVQAEVGVKYGAVHTEVDSSKGSNDFRVATPQATVAIRGSDVHVGNSEMGPGFYQGSGHGDLAYGDGTSRWLNPGAKQTNGNQTPGELAANDVAVWLGDVTGGLSQSELDIINNYLSGGGVDATFGSLGQAGFDNTSVPSATLQQYTSLPNSDDSQPFAGLPAWSGQGRWEEIGSTDFGVWGYWDGSGSWYHDGMAGTWQGSGTWEGSGSRADGTFSNDVITGSGTWQSGNRSGTWSGTGVGSGQTTPDATGGDTGTWKGAGVATDWQDTTGQTGGGKSRMLDGTQTTTSD